MYSLVYIKIARLKFMVSLQPIIWVFLLNNFSRVINLLLTKLARDRTGRISALRLFCTDRAALGPYKKDQGSIFSQYGPRAWLIRDIYWFFKHLRAATIVGREEREPGRIGAGGGRRKSGKRKRVRCESGEKCQILTLSFAKRKILSNERTKNVVWLAFSIF